MIQLDSKYISAYKDQKLFELDLIKESDSDYMSNKCMDKMKDSINLYKLIEDEVEEALIDRSNYIKFIDIYTNSIDYDNHTKVIIGSCYSFIFIVTVDYIKDKTYIKRIIKLKDFIKCACDDIDYNFQTLNSNSSINKSYSTENDYNNLIDQYFDMIVKPSLNQKEDQDKKDIFTSLTKNKERKIREKLYHQFIHSSQTTSYLLYNKLYKILESFTISKSKRSNIYSSTYAIILLYDGELCFVCITKKLNDQNKAKHHLAKIEEDQNYIVRFNNMTLKKSNISYIDISRFYKLDMMDIYFGDNEYICLIDRIELIENYNKFSLEVINDEKIKEKNEYIRFKINLDKIRNSFMSNKIRKNKGQPHDMYFRQSMAEPAMATSLFRKHLPNSLVSKIDFSTLIQQKESFSSADAGVGVVDCLYQVQISGEIGYLYLLIEHQTKPDRFMAYRLIKYMVSITEYHLKKHKKDKHLPFIYPMVLYTGTDKYIAPIELWDLYKNPIFAKELYSKFYQLIDISSMNDFELTDNIIGVMMYIYKYAKAKNIADKIEAIQNLISYMKKRTSIDYIVFTYQYILNVSDIDEDEIKELTDKFLEITETKEEKDKIMTAAERIEQKGRNEGIQQGMEVVAINMLKENCDLDLISRVTGLDRNELLELSTKH